MSLGVIDHSPTPLFFHFDTIRVKGTETGATLLLDMIVTTFGLFQHQSEEHEFLGIILVGTMVSSIGLRPCW